MNLSCVLAVAVLAGLLIWAGCGLRRLRSALCQEREENRRLRELVRAGAREAGAELEQMRCLRQFRVSGPCLKNVNMPEQRDFFRHTALIFLAIHKVLLRQIGGCGQKAGPKQIIEEKIKQPGPGSV